MYGPPDPAEAVVFAADGAWHISRLSEVIDGGPGPSTMIVGVHGLPDDDGRLEEYVPGFDAECFAAHERFIVDDAGRRFASRSGVAFSAERTGVWGASLRGELALAMGLRDPGVYGAVISASPRGRLQATRGNAEPPSAHQPCRWAAGAYFLDNATRWADALRNADADVAMVARDGEHRGASRERSSRG